MQLDFNVEEQTLRLVSLKKVVADSVDYLTCKFTFSEDWNGVTKSATFFPTKGEPYTQVLEDDGCVVPHEVIKTPLFKVSVFGGDLITTNKVIVGVVESGYVIGETPKPPTPDVYAQILNKVSESEKNTEDALKTVEKKVEEVDEALEEVEKAIADTQTAIEEVNNAKNMATDVSDRAEIAIESTCIAIENAEKATEDAQKSTESVEAVIENAENVIAEAETVIQQTKDTLSEGVANALKGTTSGEAIGITDISPIEHNMGVSVRSKNLIPNIYTTSTNGAFTYTVSADGVITIDGVGDKTNYSSKSLMNKATLNSVLQNGKTYTFSLNLDPNLSFNLLTLVLKYMEKSTNTYKYIGINNTKCVSFTVNKSKYDYDSFYVQIDPTSAIYENVVVKPILALGTYTSLPYAPYIEDISTVKLYKQGKNLFDKNNIEVVTAYIDTSGLWAISADSKSFRIPCRPNTTYTLMGENPSNTVFRVGYTTTEELPHNKGANDIKKVQLYSYYRYTSFTPLTITTGNDAKYLVIQLGGGEWDKNIDKLQIEIGNSATEYEPYIEPTVYDVKADGVVEGVTSLYPNTTLYTDTSGAVIDCTYNRDINKAFAELQNAIIAIGGLE